MSLLLVKERNAIVDVDKEQYIFKVKTPEIYQKLSVIPNAQIQSTGDAKLVFLPMHEDTLYIMQNQGLATEGLEPYYFKYKPPLIEGKYLPMAHQIKSAAFISKYYRSYNFSTMRTGKTATFVHASNYLTDVRGVPGAVLIVTTVSTMVGVWKHTIESTLPNKTVQVLHGGVGKKDRLKRLAKPAHYYIINYDGVTMIAAELAELVAAKQIGIIGLDEITHYKNPKSKRFKAINHVVNGKNPVMYCHGMTGSSGSDPVPSFAYALLVNPRTLPCRSMTAWKDMVLNRWGSEVWQTSPKPEAKKLVANLLQPSIRYDKKDIIDLPPVMYQDRDCELTKEQERLYHSMEQDMIAVTTEGEEISAVNKAHWLHKLFQIAQGCVIKPDGELVKVDNSKRVDALVEIIGETDKKVLIFTEYIDTNDMLEQQLTERGFTVGKITGKVMGKKRDKILYDFQNAKDPHICLAHPKTVAYGTEMSAANIIVFNGPPMSGENTFEQALERVSSVKQTADNIQIIFLAGTKEERKYFKAMLSGVKESQIVNDIFTDITKKKLR